MPENLDLVIRGPRVLIPSDGETAASVGIRDGRIDAIAPFDASLGASQVWDLSDDEVLMPGLVDSHVHICEPGNTEWEGFFTATRAASAGGITTLVDMPLDSVPSTVNSKALDIKRQAAEGQCHVDVGFWGGVIPGNLEELEPLHQAGVLGFKCFLLDSGSQEFPPIDIGTMQEALRILSKLDSPLLVHAESDFGGGGLPLVHSRRYSEYLASRPRGVENLAIAQVLEAARLTGGHAHICHLSSSDALPMIESARHEGVPVTAESCPHYLALCAEDIEDGATAFKCGPPIREAANRERLWDALKANVLDQIVSDHSPCTPELKNSDGGDFATAWGGISSLQVALPVVWTEARGRGCSLSQVAGWMAQAPARLAGLGRKGAIMLGNDADFCVFAPDETFVVDPLALCHRNPGTPYDGRTLSGVVRATMLRGERLNGEAPRGRLLFGRDS